MKTIWVVIVSAGVASNPSNSPKLDSFPFPFPRRDTACLFIRPKESRLRYKAVRCHIYSSAKRRAPWSCVSVYRRTFKFQKCYRCSSHLVYPGFRYSRRKSERYSPCQFLRKQNCWRTHAITHLHLSWISFRNGSNTAHVCQITSRSIQSLPAIDRLRI